MIIWLPVPPSTNSLFKNARRGRVRTKEYEHWIAEADIAYLHQKLSREPEKEKIKGDYEVAIKLPPIRGDLDNRIKAPIDWMVSREVTPDDRHLRKVSIEIDEQAQTYKMWLTITAREGA